MIHPNKPSYSQMHLTSQLLVFQTRRMKVETYAPLVSSHRSWTPWRSTMESLQEFRHWLSGTVIPVLVITDHKNLEYFMTSHQLNQRQACWSLELAKFNFKLSWIPGSNNPSAAPSS